MRLAASGRQAKPARCPRAARADRRIILHTRPPRKRRQARPLTRPKIRPRQPCPNASPLELARANIIYCITMTSPYLTQTRAPSADWLDALYDHGIPALLVRRATDIDDLDPRQLPRIAFLDIAALSRSAAQSLAAQCRALELPVIALLPPDMLPDLDAHPHISDFLLSPPDPREAIARAKQTLRRDSAAPDHDDLIRAGSLVINPSTYEVSLSGRRVNLRFKEYELLRLLASNPGRVYSREALLSSVWGYDYFGGTRTVDVHIRRLRSKIENADHPLIETIWNVGYRFRDLAQQD